MQNFIFKFNEVERISWKHQTSTYWTWTPSEDFQGLFLNFIQSVMACLNFQNTYFREHQLTAAFIRFRSTCLSEHRKVDIFFIKQPSYFFLGIFLLKESPKKYVPLFSLPWLDGIPSLLFTMFSWLLVTPSLLKNFSLLVNWKILGLHSKGNYSTQKERLLREVCRRTWFCRTFFVG